MVWNAIGFIWFRKKKTGVHIFMFLTGCRQYAVTHSSAAIDHDIFTLMPLIEHENVSDNNSNVIHATYKYKLSKIKIDP